MIPISEQAVPKPPSGPTLTRQGLTLYAQETAHRWQPKRKGGRAIPEEILKKMAQPDFEIDFIDGALDPDVVTTTENVLDEPTRGRLRWARPTEFHARCHFCGQRYTLPYIRWWQEKSLGPEVPVCQWCYRDKELKSVLTKPSNPAIVAPANILSPPCASTPEQQVAVATAILYELHPSGPIEAYIEENAELYHSQNYLTRFFNKKGQANIAALNKDFETYVEYQ